MNAAIRNIKEPRLKIGGRMYLYVWMESDKPNECKFGERWVFDGEDPKTEIIKRIKNSLGVRKDLYNQGTVVLVAYWDVSEYAKQNCPQRHKPHGRVDDFFRPLVGHRKEKTGEIHSISAVEMQIKINNILRDSNQPLRELGLSQNQYSAAENSLNALMRGVKTHLAEMTARIGKTVWAGVIIRETGIKLTIVASYVLSSFASFKKDLTSFEQFRDLVLVDSADLDWEDRVNTAMENGKQVVVFLSLCPGPRRQERIDFLFSKDTQRLVIVDEADYGAHRLKQTQPLIDARKKDDAVILMTGTNADRAAGAWKVDHWISVLYTELLIEKNKARLGGPVSKAWYAPGSLEHFMVDPSRHELVVDVEYYQMNLKSLIDSAKISDPEFCDENGAFLPSWSKVAAYPVKAKGFLVNMVQALFEGKGGDDSLNVDFQTGRKASEEIKVPMIFVPASTTNENLLEMASIIQYALPGYLVVTLCGDEDVTNATAERVTRDAYEMAVKSNKNLLILSAGMASRSYTVPEITEVFLAYDNGDVGATIQKSSRALSPGIENKIGRIISLSFDSNRDDKFDAMILETARNFKANYNISCMKEALTQVLKTVDIFKCQADGAVRLDATTFLEEALKRSSVDSVIGKISPVDQLTNDQLEALATGNVDLFRAAFIETADSGKTRLPMPKKSSKRDANVSMSLLVKAREMITTISQKMCIIRYYGGNNIDESFSLLDQEGEEVRISIYEEFGVEYELIKELVLGGFINRDLMDLKFN